MIQVFHPMERLAWELPGFWPGGLCKTPLQGRSTTSWLPLPLCAQTAWSRAVYNIITSLFLTTSHCLFRAENLYLQCLQELSGTHFDAWWSTLAPKVAAGHRWEASLILWYSNLGHTISPPLCARICEPHLSLELTIRQKSLPFIILWFCESLFPNSCPSSHSIKLLHTQ